MITFSNLWFLFVGGGLVALVAMAFVSRARRGRLLAAFLGGSRAARRLSGRDLLRLQFERIVLLGLASMAIATAAAGPRETSSEGEPKAAEPSQLRRVMVAIDVSSSMQDTDVSPTRVGARRGLPKRSWNRWKAQRSGCSSLPGRRIPLHRQRATTGGCSTCSAE